MVKAILYHFYSMFLYDKYHPHIYASVPACPTLARDVSRKADISQEADCYRGEQAIPW